ncbi:hypothetical protein [Algoriphagus sp.]|uniref:hypothetical protein n=1 Tax=Algoriphagus sp. TaxID=1872435 RepID=UPI003F7202AC
MEIKSLQLMIFGLLLLISNCGSEDHFDLSGCELTNELKSVADETGTVWFDSQAQAFAIFSGIDGTYDGQNIGIVCNLPDNYKEEGVTVVFSGKYFENKNLTPQIPGQEYYDLELSKVSLIHDK